jgi:major membrane immunogen (membrane-anchored lipoprotein)
MKKILFSSLILVLVLTGCGSSDYEMAVEETMVADSITVNEAEAPTSSDATTSSGGAVLEMKETDHKVIYNGSIRLETKEFDDTTDALIEYVSTFDGYVQSSNTQGNKEYSNRTAQYTFRIPKKDFFVFMNHVGTLGTVVRESSNSQDVTDHYFNLESRLKTLRIREERLQTYMAEALKIEDMIKLEREIQEVTTEIENLTGTLRKYDSLISLSTVTVEVYERGVDEVIEIEGRTPLFEEMRNVFISSTNVLINIVRAIILFIVGVVPFIIPVGLVLGLVLFLSKKSKYIKIKRKDNK